MRELESHFFDDELEVSGFPVRPDFIWNDDLRNAWLALNSSEPCVFISGSAGTGKSTLLRLFLEEQDCVVCVASTAIAALQVYGSTIHSTFRLPISLCLPFTLGTGQDPKFDQIRDAEFLVLEEVSMIRADVMDAVNEMCKRARGSYEPFGGLKVRLFGDCFQLPPVLTNDEKNDWNANFSYETPWFFDASVIRFDVQMKVCMLNIVYRQADADFVKLLQRIRLGQPTGNDLVLLNQKVGLVPDEDTVVLCPTNKQADEINHGMLEQIEGEEHIFTAKIFGDFPKSMYPISETLRLKVGARVMFRKNDTEQDGARQFVNGDCGLITRIGKDEVDNWRKKWVWVKLDRTGREVKVSFLTWERKQLAGKKYETVGTFQHMPIVLGFAVSLHKSQGLSLPKMHLASSAMFAPHQAYVGFSRLRALLGLTLSRPIYQRSIWVDPRVVKFYQEALQ